MSVLRRAMMVGLLAFPLVAASAPRKVRVAVMEFRPLGTEQAKADLLSEVALTRASSMKGFQVIGRSDIAALIGFEKQRQVVGCSDDYGCLAEIGGALGVDFIMVGSLGRLGTLYRLDVKLVDTKKAEVKGRIGVTVAGGEEDLVEAVEDAVEKLLKSVPPIEERAPAPVVAAAPVVAPLPPPPPPPPAKVDLKPAPPAKVDLKPAPPAQQALPKELPAPAGPGQKSKALGWTAFGVGVAAVGLGGFAVYEGVTARGKYADANAMVDSGGSLRLGESAADYKSLVSDGDDAKRMAFIGAGGAAGCAVVSGILGYLAYRQTGEVGPFRF